MEFRNLISINIVSFLNSVLVLSLIKIVYICEKKSLHFK